MILELFKVVVKDKNINKKKVADVCFYNLFTFKVLVLKSICFPLKNVMSRFLDDSGAF